MLRFWVVSEFHMSRDVLFGWSWLYTDWCISSLYTFKSLLALFKWKGFNTYSLISFWWDLKIHSTKSIIILKAPFEPISTIQCIWWFESTKRKNNIQGFERSWDRVYFLTHWVTLVSVNSKSIHQSKQKPIIWSDIFCWKFECLELLYVLAR